jgi:hypothetical protein
VDLVEGAVEVVLVLHEEEAVVAVDGEDVVVLNLEVTVFTVGFDADDTEKSNFWQYCKSMC